MIVLQAIRHFLLQTFFLTTRAFETPQWIVYHRHQGQCDSTWICSSVPKSQLAGSPYNCFSDHGVQICNTFCFMCLGCQVTSDMNECCLCGTTVAVMTVYRTRHGILGSVCDDYMAIPCPVWSLCQIKSDINRIAMNALWGAVWWGCLLKQAAKLSKHLFSLIAVCLLQLKYDRWVELQDTGI